MEPEAKVVTLQDVADQVGVHKSTVHRALRGDPRVEPTTTSRIRAAASRLGYDPDANQAARRLSLRKFGRVESNRLVALFFPVVFSRVPYFLRQFHGFMEVMSDAGFDVLTRILDKMSDHRLPPAVIRGDVDAVVALAHPNWLAGQQALLASMPSAARRPFITLINPVPGAWTVAADFRQGGSLAIGHLLDLGHRHCIAIDGLAHQYQERIAGMREELAARGLDPQRHLVVLPTDDTIINWSARLGDVVDRLLAASPQATAILTPNDQVAAVVMRLLADRGRPVPERMSLVGFDDTDPIPGPDQQNILTSVAVPLEQIGREAARMAINPGPEPRSLVLPVSLRARGTTRAVPG